MTDPLSGRQILDTPMDSNANDAAASTIREYLAALLGELWAAGEGFSGKRPFGNSGWDYELYGALVAAGHVAGKTDEDGYVEEVDEHKARQLITRAIEALKLKAAGGTT